MKMIRIKESTVSRKPRLPAKSGILKKPHKNESFLPTNAPFLTRKAPFLTGFAAALLAAVLLTASSCSDLFTPGGSAGPSGGNAPEGKALVKLAIHNSPALDALVKAPALDAAGGAKSLMPGPPAFTVYDLEFTSPDFLNGVSRSNVESGVTVELEPGTWRVAVIAKRSASAGPGAKGSSGYVTFASGDSKTLSVTLDVYDYSEGGTGDFSWYVSSELAGTVDITLRPLGGGPDINVVQGTSIAADGPIAGVKNDTPVGDYDLFVEVSGPDGKTAGMYQAVQVYRGLETGTGGLFSFAQADFRDQVWLEGTLSLNMAPGLSLWSGDNLEVGLYSNSDRDDPLYPLNPGSTFTMSGPSHTWQVKVPYTSGMDVYAAFRVRLSDGTWVEYRGFQTPGVPENGRDGLDCTIQVFAVDIPTFEDGTVSADKVGALEGDDVTFTVSPAGGYSYKPDTLTINGVPVAAGDLDAEGRYTAVMPFGGLRLSGAVFYKNTVSLSGTLTINAPSGMTPDSASVTANGTLSGTASINAPGGSWDWDLDLNNTAGLKENITVYVEFSFTGSWTEGLETKTKTYTSGQTLTVIPDTGKDGVNETINIQVYAITGYTSAGGAVTSSDATAWEGKEITLTVTPAGGYEHYPELVTVSGGASLTPGAGDTYTFTMPASTVAVTGAAFRSTNAGLVFSLVDDADETTNPVLSGSDTTLTLENYDGTYPLSLTAEPFVSAADLSVSLIEAPQDSTVIKNQDDFTIGIAKSGDEPKSGAIRLLSIAQNNVPVIYTISWSYVAPEGPEAP